MNTILTDDEIDTICDRVLDTNGHTCGSLIARAVEAAVLAKLAQQSPARAMHLGWDTLDNGTIVATYALPVKNRVAPKLYLHPAPQQADRQRVPEGWKLVPVEPTDEMVDAACDTSDFFRVDFVRAWDAAIKASPELTQSATSHTHKVVPVTPTKEMLISGARAPVELLSPDGALQVYRAMLAAAPEAPAVARDKLKVLADAYAAQCSEFARKLASGKPDDSMSPIAVSAGDARMALHLAINAATKAPAQAECSDCNGTGADGGKRHEDAIPCSVCQGSGKTAAPEAPAQASAVDERDRKDAERYRFIRNADRSDPHLPYQALMAYACESFDEAIDDAMEEEARAALAPKVQLHKGD